jgi:hypothetical protein
MWKEWFERRDANELFDCDGDMPVGEDFAGAVLVRSTRGCSALALALAV